MKRLLFLLVSMFCMATYAQNCPFKVRFEKTDATCFNNGQVEFILLDDNDNEIAIDQTTRKPVDENINLMNIKYYYRNMGDTTTHYTPSNIISTFEAGQYVVGVQAVCSTGEEGGAAFRSLDTNIVVTITSSYVTPSISPMANIATDSIMYGNRPTLPCLNTGRVQLNITGGSFPYTIKIVNEATDDTIRTVVFNGPQYTGSNSNNYNYVNYFSFDSLAKGSYRFYFTDGCSFNYNVAMDVRDLEIPVIEVDKAKIYAGLGNSSSSYNLSPTDSNKILFRFFFKGESYNYYYKELANILQYRFINDIAGGTSYTSPWYPFPLDKAASDYYYLNSAEIYIIDTVKTVNQYCALYNQNILWEGRSTSCSSTTNYSKTFRLDRTYSPCGHDYNTKTTHLSEVHYDACQFTANDLVHIPNWHFYTNYSTNEWSTSSTNTYYWTLPLHYCFIDNDTHDTIKTIDATIDNNTVYLYDTDIEDKYGSFEVNDRNINLRWTVTDDQGCVLHDAVNEVKFYHDTMDNVYNSNRWGYHYHNSYYYEGDEYPDYCCQNKQGLYFYEHFSMDGYAIYPEAMRLLRDGCQFKITSSPYDNMYNMTATYNYDQNKWIVQREDLHNTVEITGEINTSQLTISIYDYCLPSGEYKYEFITKCDTFREAIHADFADRHSIRVAQKPKYTFTQTCDDAYITPIEGQYDLVAANIHAWDDYSSNNEYHANDPYETTTPGDAYFKVISGPEGGYPTNLFPLNSPIRFSKPGTYTIRMLSADTIFYCEAETFDTTITYSGGAVEFESAAAYLCEATSSTGNIVARARYGTAPYTFKVYSEADLQGTLLASNNTGKFTELPISAGQTISIELTDACGYDLYVNLDVTDMSQSQIAWFDGGLQLKESCEGSTIEVYALLLGEDATYHWTGPNGYDKYTTNSTINLPRGSESGYYHIELSAPGCSATLKDSVYLRVITSPSVTISEGSTVCPGEEVTMTFTPSGTNGTIHYVIGQEENSMVTYHEFSGDNGQTESITFNAFADNTLWVNSVKDDICSFSLREGDKIVDVRDDVVSACNITTSSETICYNTDVDLTASASGLTYPYTIKWYADVDKKNLLQTDEIDDGQSSTFHVNALTQDTSFYVTAVDANTCETQYGYVSSWMNMKAGTTELACGESKRLFDSGGSGSEYSPNENISHTFTTTSGHITIDFTMFNTLNEDVLKVISGPIASATSDSIIAELSGNINGATYTSKGNTLSLLFISKRNAGYPGWDAIVSCDAKPAQSTVKVLDPVTVELTTSPELPLHYNSDVTITATAHGGKEESYQYTWYTSTDDGSSWTQAATTSNVLNLTQLSTTTLVKVEVADNATDHCLDIAQEQLTIHIADIALDMTMSCQQAKTCVGNFSVDLTVTNGGTETATNIVCKLNFPSYISYVNSDDDPIDFGYLGANENKTVTVDLYNAGSFNTATTVNIQGQIWSADQGDSRLAVEYGDWDWQRTTLQADEDTASILVPAAAKAEDYIITIPEQAVCYGATAVFVATPNMTPPATISWYEDKGLSTLLHSDVLTNPGDVSTYAMTNVTSYKSYYLTIENENVCPITASVDYSDKLNYYRVTGNVNMHNGTTIINNSDHIRFYDSGGPNNSTSANENYTHTFKATDGSPMALLLDYTSYNGSFSVYNGPDILQSLPITSTTTTFGHLYTSATGYITIRYRSDENTSDGWKGHVFTLRNTAYNEAKATVKSPLAAGHLTTESSDVCFGATATLTASSDIAYPQTYTWYASDMSRIVKEETINSGNSTLQIENATTAQPYYVTVGNESECPVEMPFFYSTVLMNNINNGVTTTLHDKEVVNFFDEGGPNNNYNGSSAKTYTHTFTTEQGQVVMDFEKYLYLCQQWDNDQQKYVKGDTLFLYDGTDDSAPLLDYITGDRYNPSSYTSTNGSITAKFVICGTCGGHSGWKAKVTNSATAPVQGIVLLNSESHNQTTILTPSDSVIFYDEGGSFMNYQPNHDYTHTFIAMQGNVKMNFTDWISLYHGDINSENPANRLGDTLYIYDGADTHAPMLTKLTEGSDIIFTSTGNSLTVRFKSHNHANYDGWKASVTTTNPQASMAEAHISFKSPLTASDVTASDVEVCYGGEATLTASSSITPPQYFTWYSSNLNTILKRDTVTSGNSTLEIAAATSAQPYYVSVGNATNCPVEAHTYNTYTLLLNSTSNGATTSLHDKDIVNFYDEGGPENSYSSRGNLIHTFTTDEGQVIIDFNNNDCIYLCSHWDETLGKDLYDSLYFYDGTDDSAPLIAQYGNTCERPVIKSTTNSLTVKFVSARADGNSNSGWRARVYNSATAVTPTPVMLSASNDGKTTTITPTDSILFYDEGGEQGNYLPNSNYTHTFTTLQGNVKMTFISCINFSYDWDSDKQEYIYDDTLFLYDGANTTAPILAKITQGCDKTFTSTGNSMTVRFVSGSRSNNGWKASVTDANPQANMAQANITFKTPLDASSINTVNDSVCYGNEATLKASSSIEFPQYFTWYSSDLSKILKRDTLNSGVSTFKIDSAISAQRYYVSVGNATNCPVEGHIYNTSTLLLNETSNGATTSLHEKDVVNFYDAGGPKNSYSSKGNLIHTFTTDEGQVIIDFNTNDCINLCSYWENDHNYGDTLYFYDGPDDSSPLLAQYGSNCNYPVIKSTTNSLTVKLVSARADGSGNSGWRAKVYNSATSVASTPVLLSASNNGKTTTITPTDNILFYDEGGKKDSYQPGCDYSHTFTSIQGNVQISFINCINLAEGWNNKDNNDEYLYDSLYIYDGASTDATLLARYKNSTCNNPTIVSTGTSLTVRLKSFTNYSNSGWEAQVTAVNAEASLAEAYVAFRSPIDPSSTTTTNDEVCYGQDATLTAQNDHIAYPQYYTWYDKDGATILKRDTLTSEGSTTTLNLTNQTAPTNYYVTVSNDTACAYTASSSEKIVSTILLNATTNGKTSYVTPADLIQLFDDGGDEKNYSTPQDHTYTFTSTQGNITANLNEFEIREYDTVYFYNGTTIDNAHLITALSDYQYGTRISSDDASMTIRFVAKGENSYTRRGFVINFTSGNSPQSGKATATVSIKAPEVDNGLTTTTSTEICYGDDATLSATSTLATPQYFTWYDESFSTVIGRDTVTTDGAAGELLLTNQTENGTYYVTVENATSCPMVNYSNQGSVINFNLDADKDGLTTYLKEGDVLYFYDAGGPDGDYTPNLDVTHTITAPEGSNFSLTFPYDHISLPNAYICLFPGTEVLDDDEMCLSGGDIDPVQWGIAGVSITPEMLDASSNSFTIRFISGEDVGSGFFFIFKVAPDPTTSVSLSSATNGQTTIVSPTDIVAVYDEGGASGSYKTQGEFVHTFTATQGTLAGDFIKKGENKIYIDSQDTIYIYDGAAVDASHLIATIDRYGESGPTEFASTGKSLTFRFKVNEGRDDGFEAHIHNVFSLEDVPSSKVTVKALSHGVGELTICDNDLPYTLGDTTFKVGTVSGTYQVMFPEASANGCDSIATVDLTVNEGYTLMEEDTIYAYQLPYTWKDTTFLPGTVSGIYTLTRKCVNGCDSTLTLDLTVIQCVDTVEKVTLQVNYTELPYTWRDTIFETNSVSGTFTFYEKTFDGCDSTVILTLTILDNLAPVATPTSITATTVVCCADTTAAVTTLEALNTLGFTFTDNDSEVYFKGIKSSIYTGTTCQGTRTTIYEVEDDSHNVTEVTYIQRVNDSIAPALTGTWPANITGINSQLVDSLVNKLYTNNQVKDLYNDCHEITVTSTDATVGSDCGWTITRTYTIEDACGNTAETKSMRVSGFDMSALPQAEKGVSRTGQIGTAADNLNFVNEKGGKVTLPRVTRTGRLIKATVPTVSTAAVSDTTTTSALCGGEIVSDGGADLMARGVCWSTQPNPTLTNNLGFTNDGFCTGTFSSELTGLTSGTTYYVRAYATNGMGTSYGEVISFTTK